MSQQLPKWAPKIYTCPACDAGFKAAERKAASGLCPHCGVGLRLIRERKQEGRGFEHVYVIDQPVEELAAKTVASDPDLMYKVIEVRGNYPVITVEKLLNGKDDKVYPSYRVRYKPAKYLQKCFCPRCRTYMFESQVLKTGGSRGMVVVCRAKGKEFSGQCKTKTEFIFE